MIRTIEIIAVFALIAVGLSQIYVQRPWMGYYHWMAAAGARGVRIHGLMSGALGLLILRLHPVWTGAGMLLTFLGGLLVAEGAMGVFIPQHGLRSLVVFDDTLRPRLLLYMGVALIIVAGVLTIHLFWPR